MPAIYIQLAGERTHFTSPAAPSAVSLKLTRAFQVRLQLATGSGYCATVARAACHNCGHVCFDLQRTLRANAQKCQGWPRCSGAGVGAAGDVAAPRAHDAALNCRIV